MEIKNSLLDLVGNTPLVELKNIEKELNLKTHIFAKLERNNPTGSVKDRAAKEIIVSAIKKGKIKDNTAIIESTSGNTGISLSAICASLGLKLYIFMPKSASVERIKIMRAFGTTVFLVDGDMSKCLKEANEFAKTQESYFFPSQFDNFDNALAHYKTTGPEIYKDLDGKVDIFVAGFGTGGTLCGTSRYLKEQNKNIKSVGVEPLSSPFITKSEKGAHKIQGIGAGFKPEILDLNLVDEILDISNEEAYEFTRLLAKKEGLFCGISSGAALAGAVKISKITENNGKNIIIVLPDNGERYLSVENLYE